jgi:hypothetical protein
MIVFNLLYVNKLRISFIQRVPEEGLVPEIYWLCSVYDILKTICIRPKYTQENIKHISLRIGQCREAVPNTSMKRKATNNKYSAPKHLKIPHEPKIGPCPIHLMTIHWDNECLEVRVLLDSGCSVPVLSSKIVKSYQVPEFK